MSVLIMILLLSVLILVHEAGHFLAARFFGIKVDKFGFGLPIGPTLFETQWGDTKILIHAFILGGYVSFPDDEKDCELDKDSPERFSNRPIYQRAVVFSAGVFANVLCAFFFVFLTASLWGHLPSGKYDVFANSIIAPKNESVWQSGLKDGDRILEINGSNINSIGSLISFVRQSKAYDGKVDKALVDSTYIKLKALNPVFQPGELVPESVAVRLPESFTEAPVKITEKVLKGMKKYKDSQISLSKSQIKLRDDLKNNKKVYVSNGKCSLEDIAYALSDNVHPLTVKVDRNKQIITLNEFYPNDKGQIGVKLEARELLIPTENPIAVLKSGSKYLYDNTYMLVYGLYQIFTGQIPLKDLHGIVAITKVGGDIIDNNGIFSGLLLVAIISMDLAIVNFLPIPALDGGHMLFLLIEKLRGKPVSETVIEKVANAGFMFLILLMFVVIFNDIFGLITKKF